MYICIYVYMYICIYVYMYICIYVYVYMYCIHIIDFPRFSKGSICHWEKLTNSHLEQSPLQLIELAAE